MTEEINWVVEISLEDKKVYQRLVPSSESKADGDKFDAIVGMIAYANYFLERHQYIDKHIAEEEAEPEPREIKKLIYSFTGENSVALENLKTRSELLLKDYTKAYAELRVNQNVVEPVDKIVKHHTNFWRSVLASILGSFFYSLIIAAVIFIATVAMPDSKFAQVINILFEETGQSTESQ